MRRDMFVIHFKDAREFEIVSRLGTPYTSHKSLQTQSIKKFCLAADIAAWFEKVRKPCIVLNCWNIMEDAWMA